MLNLYETITIVIVAVSILFLIVFVILDRLQYRKKQYLYNTVAVIIFLLIVELFISWEIWTVVLYLYPLYIAAYFLIYPYLYLYYEEILESVSKFRKPKWKYFILFFVSLIVSVLFYISLDNSGRLDLIENRLVLNIEYIGIEQVYFILIYVLYYAQFIYYIIKLLHLASYSAGIESQLNGRYRSWIYIFITSVVTYELLLIVVTFFLSEEVNLILNQFFGLVILTFVGILALKQSTFLLALKINSINEKHNQPNSSNILTGNEKSEIAGILENYLREQKIFLDPNLKLNNLARKIHIPEKKLSFVINQVYSVNFNKFINTFRIEEAKKILLEQNRDNVENLYLLTGFNSRGTFNRAFKEITNLTPREFYIKNISKK